MNFLRKKAELAKLQAEYEAADAHWKEVRGRLEEARHDGASRDVLTRLEGECIQALAHCGNAFMAIEWRRHD